MFHLSTKKIARIISTIFIPPTFTLISLLYLAIRFESRTFEKIITIAIALVFGFIFQLASFFYFYKRGLIADVDAKIRQERTLPYMVSIVIFISGLILLLGFGVSNISIAFWFCYISNAVLVIFINKYFKISIHMMGAAGPLALFSFELGLSAIIFLPLLFLIGWSRIKLGVHSLIEVIAGGVFGFLSVYLQLYFLLI